MRPLKTALVLTGGGARGAYEAGVLKYLREELPRYLGRRVRFEIICGTSVGAINSAFIAATADRPDEQASMLVAHWRSLAIGAMFDLGIVNLMRAAWLVLGGRPRARRSGEQHRGGILDTSGLEHFVTSRIPWSGISANLKADHLEALTVSATQVATGRTVVFVDNQGGTIPTWSRDPFVEARATAIEAHHVLASAAIPVLFPSVAIRGRFYCDGGLRHNTPLAPALRLGADRVLVISLRHVPTPMEEQQEALDNEESYPSPWFVFGKALNSMLLDHTDYDLDRLHRINALVASGQKAAGHPFVEELNAAILPMHGQGVRVIRDLLIRPSKDIGAIAAVHARRPHLSAIHSLTGHALRHLAGEAHEADLLSYLLFDGEYASDLIDLGLHDARAREEEFGRFFTEPSGSSGR